MKELSNAFIHSSRDIRPSFALNRERTTKESLKSKTVGKTTCTKSVNMPNKLCCSRGLFLVVNYFLTTFKRLDGNICRNKIVTNLTTQSCKNIVISFLLEQGFAGFILEFPRHRGTVCQIKTVPFQIPFVLQSL